MQFIIKLKKFLTHLALISFYPILPHQTNQIFSNLFIWYNLVYNLHNKLNPSATDNTSHKKVNF